MERFNKPPASEKPKPDFTTPNAEKQQRALARGYFFKAGKVKQFDEAMRQVDTENQSNGEALSADARRDKIIKGTVDKEILGEASRRRMHAGGKRPLKEFIDDVLRERESAG